jgi:hypothetical protein
VTLLRGLASRAKALLLTEADEVFETMDRRKRRRFRQHPLRVHLLYLLGYATGAAAVWYAAGARVALVIWGLPLLGLLLAVVNGAIRRWRRDPSSAQQLPPGARPAEPSSSDERAREGAADTRPERSWGISLLLALPALALVGFATLLVAAGVATIHDEGWAGSVLFLVAALPLYPAWLLTRSAFRIRHANAPPDRARRRFSIRYALFMTAFMFLAILIATGSAGIAIIAGFGALTATAFGAAGGEPSLKRKNPTRGEPKQN